MPGETSSGHLEIQKGVFIVYAEFARAAAIEATIMQISSEIQ